jgi:cholesterol oxidase
VNRLSSPVGQMRDHYSAVVVGSGYGGAIAAARIAEQGRDVCVLERGRERHPGEYPATGPAALAQTQVQVRGEHHGSATAMFDFHVSPDLSVLVGCGLGGTSLINANVALEPDAVVFDDNRWPASLRGDRGLPALRPYFQRARDMLRPQAYPQDLPRPARLAALQKAAGTRPFERPPLNVTFTAHTNDFGVEQAACTLCGNCCTGCNDGAKNTVLMNYLPYAHSCGADIFTEVAVRTVRWNADLQKWQLDFDLLSEGRTRYAGAPSLFVTADVVVLAAGTLGTTEILLRSRELGLPLSDRLGERFSGNGDVLAFAYDTGQPVHGVGRGPEQPQRPGRGAANGVAGPTITGMIDLRGSAANRRKALIVEDAAIPGALAGLLPSAMFLAASAAPGDDRQRTAARRLREAADIPLGAYRGPVDRTLTYLVMSTDNADGKIVLKHDRAHVEWPEVSEQPVFATDNTTLSDITNSLGGVFVPDPLWLATNGRSLITVHPLGGCVMADDVSSGVVDDLGRVFDPTGSERLVHRGLYVADGSVVPLALDVNPLLTISALAERIAARLVKDNWPPGQAAEPARPRASAAEPAAGPTAAAAAASPARLRFTERLAGFASMQVPGSFRDGQDTGRAEGASVEFLLTIEYDDVEAMLRDPAGAAEISGTVLAPELSQHRLVVTAGTFRLLVPDPERVETSLMRYDMQLLAEDGRRYHVDGHKIIRDRGASHAWHDTTTLYVTITAAGRGTGETSRTGKGIVRLHPGDFATLLGTIGVHGVPRAERIGYRREFLALFGGEMVRFYGGPLDEPSAFPGTRRAGRPKAPPAVREPGPADVIWWRGAREWTDGGQPDDAFLRLTRYNKAGSMGPVMLAPGFGMSTHSFLAPTIRQNLVEHLVERNYDVWLFDYRAGIDLPSATTDFTIDDIATQDWPLAVEQVLAESGRDSLQAFGHCVGSVSLQMALVKGLTGVRSAVCAQFPLHPVASAFDRAKAELRLGNAFGSLGIHVMNTDIRKTIPDGLLDISLRALPIPRHEHCGQAVCRWINAIYGLTHRHAQLNDATHRAINDMFGVGSMTALTHLLLMLRKGLAVNHRGENVYLEGSVSLPDTRMLLVQGQHNYIFRPPGTLRTQRWLRAHNPAGHYERVVLPEYGHLDAIIGSRADRDVYPKISDFLDRS